MKLSVSVPDELWVAVHPDGAGPSETVQRALRALAVATGTAQRPLAHAPDQANLERYRSDFESAVKNASRDIQLMRDNGYRFGLILARGLDGSDFDNLDDPSAGSEIYEIMSSAGDYSDGDVFSGHFIEHVMVVLSGREELEEIVGNEQHPKVGVRWEDQFGPKEGPVLSDTFIGAVISALQDVRAEAIRRLDVPPWSEGEER